ncbi:MAG: calcium-translocating P-type ATPase, PMCA-type [Clostridia bacterium]|nr:calcium-translocating P-type ATPase, PMCA-type [Clostridia bacterium]
MTKNLVGLSMSEVAEAREKYGANKLEKKKTKGFFSRFFDNLNDPIIKVLIIALLIEVIFTLGHCNLLEVMGIVVAILIATTVSTVSEMGSARAFLQMESESGMLLVRVLRDGAICEIPSEELVVGDIVYLSSGERIAADGALLYGCVSVDQSALNGESREVTKRPCAREEGWELSSASKVFSGTVVASGEGIMRVGRVGADSYYGMVARDVQSETRESPLKLRLGKLASQISRIGYVMAALVATIYLFNAIVLENGFSGEKIIGFISDFPSLIATLMHALTLAITVIVVAVPEGLPMMITVVLSANMKRMFRDSVLVKKLVGIETAGSLNILFTDKTGTVTTGEPSLESIECEDGSYKGLASLRKSGSIYDVLRTSALYNTDSYISEGRVLGGNGTDRAIVEFFKGESVPRLYVDRREPFSSEKKYSTVRLSDGREYIKGAPEVIISMCSYSLSEDGSIRPIRRARVEAKLKAASERGARVIATAYRECGGGDYVFVALLVLSDVLRRDSRDAILAIRGAGVQIVMLTGDGRDTAVAIARECGIMGRDKDEIVLTSGELASLSDEEVKRLLPRLRVLARALPQDKTRLVRLSQELQLVVGMTGDGINDAPALKLADVGFAMGSGTDIAKGAGDVVIINNSLYAINRTILYGRTIFKSIRKFITFQLIMNFAACGVSILGQLVGVETPITIIQMLWVNIIMDTLGGLAFSGEPALSYYMKEAPKRRDEPILTSGMLARILVMGTYTLVLCLVFLKADIFRNMFLGANAELRLLTAFYALFIFLGIFNCFAARCERMWVLSNISKNKPFVVIMLLISLIQMCIIFYGGEVFRSSPLSSSELWMVLLLAFSVIPFDTARRIVTKMVSVVRRKG